MKTRKFRPRRTCLAFRRRRGLKQDGSPPTAAQLCLKAAAARAPCRVRRDAFRRDACSAAVGRGENTVGNPHRAQISQFELFELILLLKLDKHFPVEQFEATVSQSPVPSPPS